MGTNLRDYVVLGIIGVGVMYSVKDVNESVQELNKTVTEALETNQELNGTMEEALETNTAQQFNGELESRIKIEDVNKDGILDLYVVIGDKKFVAYGNK